MKLTYLKSAGVLIEAGGCRLLCDPWLEDGAYYGSWAHVPPCDVTPAELGDLAGIYITHIHPDHASARTLQRFPRSVPVYIHRYAWPHLADYVRSLGFVPVEVPNGESVDLGGLRLTIYAADNCDPTLCGRFFGCDARVGAERPGSVQIDSMAVIDDGVHSIVNVNDCPVELAGPAMQAIHERWPRPDFLLTNYVGAGPYPQCMASLTAGEKATKAAEKQAQFLCQAERWIRALEPRAYMPFAGTYTLAGRLARLNQWRGTPTQQEAAEWLGARIPEARGVVLSTRQTYDLATWVTTWDIGGVPSEWTPEACATYQRDVLAARRMDYEADPIPDEGRLLRLLRGAGGRFARRCQAIGFVTRRAVYVEVDARTCYRLPDAHRAGRVMRVAEARGSEPHLILRTDPRLLLWLLEGRAHWEEASIGSHIEMERRPDAYERGLFFALNELRA